MSDPAETLYERARRAVAAGDAAAALALYGEAMRRRPTVEGYQNSALLLSWLGRFDEAVALSARSLEDFPGHAVARANHGMLLARTDRLEAAIAAQDRALELMPQFNAARRNKAECLLQLGRYREGFALLERYWAIEAGRPQLPPRPRWVGGQALRGKRVLWHREPHYGNALQLVRYARLAAAAGAGVLLAVQPSLQPLLAGAADVAAVHAVGDGLPQCDLEGAFRMLPYLFDTTLETVPREIPYLAPPLAHRDRWAGVADAPPGAGPRIGLCFRGGGAHMGEHDDRAMPLPLLLRLVADTGCRWFCLQIDASAAEREQLRALPNLVDLGARIADWADSAAIVARLDLVLSVDTGLAHLAGALGKPLWVLAPFSPAWQWRQFGAGPAWYPAARVWRQPRPGDWPGLVAAVRAELARDLPGSGRAG